MNKKAINLALCFLLLTPYFPVEAQQSVKIPRVGFLQRRIAPTSTNPDPLADAFKQGLQELGYIEGKNIRLEHRYAGGKSDRLPGLIAEFLQLKVDIIVVASTPAIRLITQATQTTPIVIITQLDPVAAGLVDSLARPGSNITGLTRLTDELSGKRLELLKETIPRVSRVGLLDGGTNFQRNFQDYAVPAGELKLAIQSLQIPGANPNFDEIFRAAKKDRLDAIITIRDAVTASYARQIGDLAIKYRLPLISEDSPYVEAGGLMSYSANDAEQLTLSSFGAPPLTSTRF